MTIRPVRKSDLEALKSMRAHGFDYPDVLSPLCESALVAVDEEDRPIMAIAGFRAVHIYLWPAKTLSPTGKFHVLRSLVEVFKGTIISKGYDSAESFVSPTIAKSFGNRLIRSFGAVRNWPSFNFRR